MPWPRLPLLPAMVQQQMMLRSALTHRALMAARCRPALLCPWLCPPLPLVLKVQVLPPRLRTTAVLALHSVQLQLQGQLQGLAFPHCVQSFAATTTATRKRLLWRQRFGRPGPPTGAGLESERPLPLLQLLRLRLHLRLLQLRQPLPHAQAALLRLELRQTRTIMGHVWFRSGAKSARAAWCWRVRSQPNLPQVPDLR